MTFDELKEEWRDIKGFEGYYMVCNKGCVKSLDRYITVLIHGVPTLVFKKGQILSPHKNNKGYYVLQLHKNGKVAYRLLHRCVAEAFIPNPNNLPEVNHEDEDKTNCCADNLTWCTRQFNNNYGIQSKEGRRKTSEFRMRSVEQLDKQGNLIAIFKGIRLAEEKTGVNNRNIIACCKSNAKGTGYKGVNHSVGGFIWRYHGK